MLVQAYGNKPNKSSTAENRALPSSSQSVLSDHKPVSESLFVSDGSEGSQIFELSHIAGEQDEKLLGVDSAGRLASRSTDGDEKFKRLFIVYQTARKDFDATPAKTLERTKSAKFLRDTTENCLAYMAAKGNGPGAQFTCDGMMNELRVTLEETIAIAEQGSGGKKRRFDENWENVPQEPSRMRGRGPSVAQPVHNTDPVPRGRTSEKKQRPITSRIREHQLPPNSDYPASASQSVRRVFGQRHKPHVERKPFSSHVHGDRYRPTYR